MCMVGDDGSSMLEERDVKKSTDLIRYVIEFEIYLKDKGKFLKE